MRTPALFARLRTHRPRRLGSGVGLALAMLPVLLAGCQSKRAGLEVVCQAPLACEGCAEAPPEDRAMYIASHIEANLSNGEVKTLFEALAGASPEARTQILRAELDAEGITDCPLLDTLATEEE